MNVEINFTYLTMGLSLCLVCNLGTIRGHFRWVFGSVLFASLFLQLKRRKAGDCRLPFTAIERQFWSEKISSCCRLLVSAWRWFELTNESAECNGRVHAKSPAHGKITDSWMFFEFSQTRIAVWPLRRLSGMQKLRGFMNMVFLWLFSALRCDTRAICWTRSSAVTRLPLF